jgi:hypothetical protein
MSRELGDVKNYLRLSGQALFTPDGENGAMDLGNILMHKLDYGLDTKEHRRSTAGVRRVDRLDVVGINPTYEIESDEAYGELLALIFFGVKNANAVQASAAAQTVSFAGVKKQRSYNIGKIKVSDVVVKVGVATKVLGTDYTLDADNGVIHILSGGSIADAATVDVEFDCAEVTRESFTAMKSFKKSGTMRLLEVDSYDGQARHDITFACDLFPDTAYEANPDDFSKFKLKCLARGEWTILARTT